MSHSGDQVSEWLYPAAVSLCFHASNSSMQGSPPPVVLQRTMELSSVMGASASWVRFNGLLCKFPAETTWLTGGSNDYVRED